MKITAIVVLYLLALAGAATYDCTRLMRQQMQPVSEIDAELMKLERRFISNLPETFRTSPHVREKLNAYEQAAKVMDRHAAFDVLVVAARTMQANETRVEDPLLRAAADELAGALNRRRIVMQTFDDRLAAFNLFSNSWRGKIAQSFVDTDFR